MSEKQSSSDNRFLLLKYAGLATQWLIIMLLAVFAGKRLDHWFRLSKPLLSWILPLLSIVGMLIHIIRDTSAPKKK
jgi:membrane protein DedA with SNARE-associated domain